MSFTIALILKGYPRLSETFIAQEIKALEERGFRITIVSLRHPTDKQRHPIHREIQAPVIYLPEYLYQEPWRVLKATFHCLRHANLKTLLPLWWRDFKRDTSSNRLRRLGQSLVLAAELPADIGWLYAHFIHTPGSVTRYTSALVGLPWSCSAHAKDIWTSPAWELREKIAAMRWLVTCTQSNVSYLQSLADDPNKIKLVYHGLNFARFMPPQPSSQIDAEQPVQIISVGRAVAKKGYDILLQALAQLPDDLAWHFTHIGGGPLLADLKQQAAQLGIAEYITWLGSCSQEVVLKHYRNSDIFVLASVITADGDRDGLPNVLMEAQSQHLACIATDISGIPELIVPHETGLLIPPGDTTALTEALSCLIQDKSLRSQLASGGFERVHQYFSLEENINTLVDTFNNRA